MYSWYIIWKVGVRTFSTVLWTVQVSSVSIPQLGAFCFLFFSLPQFLSYNLTHSYTLTLTLAHALTLSYTLILLHTDTQTHSDAHRVACVCVCVLAFHYQHSFWPSFMLNNSLHMTFQLVNNKFSPREKSKLHFLCHSCLFANQQCHHLRHSSEKDAAGWWITLLIWESKWCSLL